MKLSAIVEDDENMVMVPLYWLTREERKALLQKGYQVIPITGYQESDGYRAYKIIGKYSNELYWIRNLSIPIWEDWKLTASYVREINSSIMIRKQMFDSLDDDEKIQALKYRWWNPNFRSYIKKYFREHPDRLEHARHSLNQKDINTYFKDLF